MAYTPIIWTEATLLDAVNFDIMDDGIVSNDSRTTDIEAGTTTTNASTYKGNDIDTDGDGKVNNSVQADSLSGGLSEMSIITGLINDGTTLPLPSGYTEAQCQWNVSINNVGTIDSQIERMNCYVDGNRVCNVNWETATGIYYGRANYMVIGIK